MNWKTSMAGIFLLAQAAMQIASDPKSVVTDLTKCGGPAAVIVTGIGLILAKDAKKSDAMIPQEPPK